MRKRQKNCKYSNMQISSMQQINGDLKFAWQRIQNNYVEETPRRE